MTCDPAANLLAATRLWSPQSRRLRSSETNPLTEKRSWARYTESEDAQLIKLRHANRAFQSIASIMGRQPMARPGDVLRFMVTAMG